MILHSFNNNNKGFSLIELLVVVAILGVLAAVGIVSYIGYVSGTQKTVAQSNLHAIAMVQEDFRAGNALNVYYTGGPANNCTLAGGSNCVPVIGNHADINECLFGGRDQLEETLPDFLFCVAAGAARDGGFWIRTQREDDAADWMVLNADNEKAGPTGPTW